MFAVLVLRFAGVFLFSRVVTLPGVWLDVFDRFWLIFLALYVMRVVYGQGLLSKEGKLLRHIAGGAAAGVGLFFFAQGLERMLGVFMVIDAANHPLAQSVRQAGTFRQFLAPFFVAGVLVPISEELYYRGLAYPAFKKRWGFIPGILIMAVFFAVLHFNSVWFIEILLVAAALGLLYEWTGSLLPGIIAHGMVNGMRLLLIYFHL